MTLVIAHRGASGHLPENTLPAYELAIEQRADMIEIDLHRSRDGVLVVTHDAELAGLGGRGEVAEATLEELRRLDAGGGARIPTLGEVLDRFGSRIAFNLELKGGTRAEYPGIEAAALEAVERRDLLAQTLFSSFSDAVLGRLRGLSAGARIALLVSPQSAAHALARARALAAEALNPWLGMADAELIRQAHAQALAVHVFTVDQPADMRRLLAGGVDGLFTNYPDRLRRLLDFPQGE